MACCGSEPKDFNLEKLEKLKDLRNIGKINIKMKLKSDMKDKDNEKNKDFVCQFDGDSWNANIDKVYGSANNINEEEDEKTIRKLKQEIEIKRSEIEKLEKEYLAKAVRLLYMAQVHCGIKEKNEELFESNKPKENVILPKPPDNNLEEEKIKKKKELVIE